MSFKRQVQTLVVLLVIIVAVVLTSYNLYHEGQEAAEHRKKSARNIQKIFDSDRKELDEFYTYRAYANLRSEGIIEALKARDREKLYELTFPRYQTLREENPQLMIMQFHAPDGRSILRMHRKELFGDDIAKRRPMIRMTHQTKTVHTGFEGGMEGIAYRIIVPLVEKGEYIGALEFGINPDYLIGKLMETTRIDALFMLHKSRIGAADIQKYPIEYSGYHFSHLSPYQQPLIDEFVKDNPELNQRIIKYKGKEIDVIHIHMVGNDGKPVGMLLCFNDVTKSFDELLEVLFVSALLTLIIIVIFLGIIEYVFRYMMKKIGYQEEYLNTVMNAQKNIVLVTDGHDIAYVNNAFLDYLHYRTLDEFRKKHRCICELFETGEGETYLQPEMNGVVWTEYMLANPEEEHKAKITIHGKTSTFTVNVQMIDVETLKQYVVVFSDITELNNLATLDRLTQIANRFEFDKILEHTMAVSRRYGRSLSILLVDIDHFKPINDRFGHLVGDEVLKSFSQLLRSQIRESDVVARWGGEEFIILLPDTPLSSAIKLADSLRQRTEVTPFPTIGNLTCSIGVAEFNSIEEADDLLHRADEKLYRAKNSGRNRVMA